MEKIVFLSEDGRFTLGGADHVSGLYFPLASEAGLKSAVDPFLGGDSKVDQESFLLAPVSIDDLHSSRSTRNFWVLCEEGAWSATGVSAEQEAALFTKQEELCRVECDFMTQTLTRESGTLGLRSQITSFVAADARTEVMQVRIRNTGKTVKKITGIAAIPIYGRSADNLRDHRNVTSMLHRIRCTERGVVVCPTMSFDERGHRLNHRMYYVLGQDALGRGPAALYPTVSEFLGEGGRFTRPRTVVEDRPGVPAGTLRDGKEAMGGLRFEPAVLEPGQEAVYTLLLGIADNEAKMDAAFERYADADTAAKAALENARAWQERVNIRFHTGDARFDAFMRWVCFQPFLRRIYGCSFLPHHDYGRGGRGWRDLWQDCLSLLMMEPGEVGRMIVQNCAGMRMDGTNATIIGSGEGEFIADRNGIARVWMDHALWPLMTVKLYLDETGDYDILFREAGYFRDAQILRGTAFDAQYRPEEGCRLTVQGKEVRGTVLEHLVVEHLTAFYEVGAHNHYRLRGADWNDALDMASKNGESVAFTCAYAGNLRSLADILEHLEECGEIALPEETAELIGHAELYGDAKAKNALLHEVLSRPVSGRKGMVNYRALALDLREKADWISEHVRKSEWIADGEDGFFNSYYDDSGNQVEGFFEDHVRMMLTGQVFAVMSGVATKGQVEKICRSADRYLYDREAGGYRLNTNFYEIKMDMGRQFGFAYGEKENGSVFSHMATMYANALYTRGFAREGYKAMNSLYEAAMNFDRSRIYPGLPEYFNNEGRGLYHYLTGCASWYMMTEVTQAFGVQGRGGDLVLAPQLLAAQFDAEGKAWVELPFAGRRLRITYLNPQKLEAGDYGIRKVEGIEAELRDGKALLRRKDIEALETGTEILVTLG